MEKLTHNKSTYKNFSNKVMKLLFFFSIISVCIYLGLWQIERGNQKITIYNEYKKNLSKDPVVLKQLNNKFTEFAKVRVFGEFILDKQLLLDNRIFNRKAGYEVLTPYKVGNKMVLVNRGWVENRFESVIPDISIKKPNNYIDGYIFYQKSLLQLDKDTYSKKWPKIIQNIEFDKISILLNSKLEPYILVMNEDQDNTYIINTKFKKNAELKHFMYAGQWFLFSAVAFAFMIILLRKNRTNNEKKE